MTGRTIDLAGASWRKSTQSGSGNACVEIAAIQAALVVRDSKKPDDGVLVFAPASWKSFIAQVKEGHLDN